MGYSAPPPLVLDTGPLLTYLTGQYLDFIQPDRATRTNALVEVSGQSGWDDSKQRAFETLLRLRSRRLITTHVAGEIFHLRKYSFLKRNEQQFRKFVLDRLSFFEEQGVLIEGLEQELIIQFGPTDAGLIWIARETRGELVTSDYRLFRALSSDLYKITPLDYFVVPA